ncbi:MAG: prephenate dehydrogenase [Bacillota bacterium]
MKVYVVGLGLIGASYASRLTELNHHVYGMDKNADVERKAIKDGCILANDVKYLYEADIIIIALYPQDTIDFIALHASKFNANQIITDVCGVKGVIVSKIEKDLPKDVHYVSHHPMAGKEVPGYDARDAKLFMNSNAIIIQAENTNLHALASVEQLLKTIGFSSCVITTPQDHDTIVAYTSQLPHVLAMTLVHINKNEHILSYTGNSFRDLTRIASINASLWTELFLSNQDALSKVLDDTIESLREVQVMIKNNNSDALNRYMKTAKEKRDSYGNDKSNNV